MRYHEPFTLFPRKMTSGRVVWYYRVWLGDNKRTSALSTGCATKSGARQHCRNLEKRSQLIPTEAPAPVSMTFGQLAKGFWDWTDTHKSDYIETRLRFSDPKRPAISLQYCRDNKRIVEIHLLPTFRRRRLENITPMEIESFALRLRDKGLSGKRANNVVSVMRTMLTEAYRQGTLPWDPQKKGVIRSLGTATKERGRLTVDEVRKLFTEDAIDAAWRGHLLYRVISYVAAATGMRQGEILGIRDQDVREDYLHVEHSWSIKTKTLGPTKTRQIREIPIPSKVRDAIDPFLGSGGFVFSQNGGKQPTTGNRATEALYEAMTAIGVTDRVERNVTFHSWRHWLNSTLRAAAVPDDLVRRMTGHETEEMTEAYTSYIREDFGAVAKVQERLFG